MTYEEAKNILMDRGWIAEDGAIYGLGHYVFWYPNTSQAVLDAEFSADELIAIGTYMKGPPK